jgi:hypothetical protein
MLMMHMPEGPSDFFFVGTDAVWTGFERVTDRA